MPIAKFQSARRGFTLIELLVVIAIIAILIGLLAGAVQRIREAASRLQCRNNLKQIALATHAYHDTFSVLPVNTLPGPLGPYDANNPSWSWLARILPFIEQESLYRQGNIPTSTLYQSRETVATQVKLFLCPSDPYSNRGARTDDRNLGTFHPPNIPAGQTNYQGVGGANWNYGDPQWTNPGINGSFDGLNYGDGIFYRYDWVAPKRIMDILDGASNTFMIAENLPEKTQWCSWPHANSSFGTCAIAPNVLGPGGKDYSPQDFANNIGFRSRHPGGLQFALADGSVHFVANSIELKLYRALATIQGGEVASVP